MDVIFGTLLTVMSLSAVVRTSTTLLWLFTLCDFIDEFCWYTVNPGTHVAVHALCRLSVALYSHTHM